MKFEWSDRTFRWSVIGFVLFVIIVSIIMIIRYRRSKYRYPDQVTADTDSVRIDLQANTSFNTCLTTCSNQYLAAQFQGLSDSTPPKAECIAACTTTYLNGRCPYATTRLNPSTTGTNPDSQAVVNSFNTYKNTDMGAVSTAYISLLSAPASSTTTAPSLTVVQQARKADLSGPTRKYLGTVCPSFYILPDGSGDPTSVYTTWATTTTAPTAASATSPYTSASLAYGFYTTVTNSDIMMWAKRAGQPLKIATATTALPSSTAVVTTTITIAGNITGTAFSTSTPVNFPSLYKGSAVSSANPFPVMLISPDGSQNLLANLYYSAAGAAYNSSALTWSPVPTFTLQMPIVSAAKVTALNNGIANYTINQAPSAIYVTNATTAVTAGVGGAATSVTVTINSSYHNIPTTYSGAAVSTTNGIPVTLSPAVANIPSDLKITSVPTGSSTSVTLTSSNGTAIPIIPLGTVLQLGSIPYNTTDATYAYAMPLDTAVTSSSDLSFAKTATVVYPSSASVTMPNWVANQSYGPGTVTSSSSGAGKIQVTFGS